MSRYMGRRTFYNQNELYENTFREREVAGIQQYTTPKLKHLTIKQISSLTTIPHIWTTGDRFFKLAHNHYGDSRMWWVIAWFNKKPTESDLSFGDKIYIPHPLARVLSYLGV